MPEHLEVLGVPRARGGRVVEGCRETEPLQRRLGDASDARRRVDADQIEHRRDHVDDVRVLAAHLTFGRDALRPRDDERVGSATTVGLTLPASERGVAGVGPTPRVVVEVPGATDLVDQRQTVLHRLLGVVEELRLVRRAGRPTLGTRAVVGDDHDQRVVELTDLGEELEQPAEMVIGVRQEAGVDLHEPGVQLASVRRQARPVGDIGVLSRQLGVGRHHTQFELLGQGALAVRIPAVVERTLVAVGPFLADVMRRVHRTEAQVQVERLVRIDLLGVGDELHRPVDQVLSEVVALLGRLRRLDLVVVVHQIGIPLAGVTTEETVETLEATTQRPPVVRAGRGLLVAGRQVPLADHERVVTVADQHLRQHPVLERHHPVVARVPGRQLGDAGHRVGMVVAAGDDARTTRRAQRRGVHVVVPQTIGSDRVEVRRGDRAPEATEIAEPCVVQTTIKTFGASARALAGAGQAGLDSSAVRPMTPGKGPPSGYSTTGMMLPSFSGRTRPLPLVCLV